MLLKPVPPVNFKPIAVVIEAQSEQDQLPSLSEETRHIEERFQALDFDVIPLKNPSREEIIELFSKAKGYRDRIAVFHFAGHSSEEGMSLPDLGGEGDNAIEIYFKGLAGFMSNLASLRLVFINGCESYGFEDHFSKNNGVGVVVANSVIDDAEAKDFAIKFYDEWTESSDTTVKEAFNHAKWSIESGNAPDESNDLPVGFPWQIARNTSSTLPDCFSTSFFARLLKTNYLSEIKEPGWFWKGSFLAALLIASMSIWGAYYSYTSPAFQASFGYGLTKHHVVERAANAKEPGTHGFFIVGRDEPMTGALIEFTRVVIGVFAIYATLMLLGSPFEIQHLSKSQLWMLLMLWCVILTAVAWYNLFVAPYELATNWRDQDNQWLSAVEWGSDAPYLSGDDPFHLEGGNTSKRSTEAVGNGADQVSYFCLNETLWSNAGDTWETRYGAFKATIDSGTYDGTLYKNEMFLYPYIAYCFYSLILFGFVATLLFLCVTIHTYKIANLISFLTKAIKGSRTVATYRSVQQEIANESHKILLDAFRRYSIFLCLLVLFFGYEVTWGFLTLAGAAKTLTLFAIFMIFLAGTWLLGIGYWRYSRAFTAADLDLVSGVRQPKEIREDVWVRGALWLISVVVGSAAVMLQHTW